MATAKKSVNNKLKIGKSVVINKWLALGFVAAVVASAIVIVRYSGASGDVWSINSKSVTHDGGQKITKTNGSTYWAGVVGDSVALDIASSNPTLTYCVDGVYGENASAVRIQMDSHIISDQPYSIPYHNLIGNKGQKFSDCFVPIKGYGTFSLEVVRGTIVFNRFRTTGGVSF